MRRPAGLLRGPLRGAIAPSGVTPCPTGTAGSVRSTARWGPRPVAPPARCGPLFGGDPRPIGTHRAGSERSMDSVQLQDFAAGWVGGK